MLKTEGKGWIEGMRIKLITLYFFETLFFSLAVAIVLWPISLHLNINTLVLSSIAFTITFIVILAIKRTWKITTLEVASYLNIKYPVLEESANLYLVPEEDLSLLEKLQIAKMDKVLPIAKNLNESIKGLWLSLFLILIALVVNVYLPKPVDNVQSSSLANYSKKVEENILPEIKDFKLKIEPPGYTGKPTRSQRQFSMQIETGAQVTWSIQTNVPVKKLRLIFNDKEIVEVKSSGQFTKIIHQSGFYQVELEGKKSDLYPIEVIADLPVSIKITQPKPHTTIDIGQAPRVNLSAILTDDYGIKDAFISATLSSGKGEGVSFTEKKLTFAKDFSGTKTIKLDKLLDLNALGMKPGDELYFFINALDNNGQTSRSDVYLISIVDPAELMSMAGMTNGVDLVPEYFRSQRQIIIDTEKLLKEQPMLAVDEFKNRSNVLGMDQKLLRLRYGKFLGEESETGVGGEHDHEEGEEHKEAAFGDVKALMDEYAHKHDIAEDATFFEPELKAQLKAVLNEMWSAELRLRTYQLQEALPFEYKALRLLKDLQQKSRAYVAKTTIKTAKLKMEKRLSGELDKITTPSQQLTFEPNNHSTEELKLLLAALEHRKTGKSFAYGDRELLREGERQLILAAANQPMSYLPALKSLRKLSTSSQIVPADMGIVQKALVRLIGTEISIPQAVNTSPEANLYRSYFNRLKDGN